MKRERAEEKKIKEAKKLAARTIKESPMRDIKDGVCPVCDKATMNYSEDLVFETYEPGERLMISSLRGLKCKNCGNQAYDMKSLGVIEKAIENLPVGGYECTISTLGSEKFGIYLPKDVLRVMGIKAKIKAIITPITKKKMIIELEA